MSEQLELIAHFLSKYVTPKSGGLSLPADPTYIKNAIHLLIKEKVMTADEIRREILEEQSVIIPYDFFPKEEGTDGREL